MVQKYLIPLLLVFYYSPGFAQKEAYNWYFGTNAGVTFNTSPPSALTNGKLSTTEGCATISTPSGRLLFYTDGISVWDSTHNKMPNGTGLKGNPSSTQSGVIVPRPDSAHIFYIFTVAPQGYSDGLQYTEINMKLNSGKGDVVTSNKNVLLKTPVCEKITAIKKSNGIDYWVLAMKYGNDSFFSYSVTSAGVSKTPVAFRSGMTINSSNNVNTIGYLKVSPDGKKVAFANYGMDTSCVGDFDVSTGKISNLWHFYVPAGYGVEFSSKSYFVYFSEFVTKKVVQFDLSTKTRSSFIASRKVVDSSYSNSPSALQIAPDGKIYISVYNATNLSVIHAPDSAKFSCRPQKNYISLSSKAAQLGLPTFIQSYFQKRNFKIVKNCMNDSTIFQISDLNSLDSVRWDFNDPSSGANNTSNKKTNVYHTYSNSGYYTASLIYYYKTNKDTFKLKFYVAKPIKVNLGADTNVCNAAITTLKPQKNYLTYLWSNGSTAQVTAVTQKGTYILKTVDTSGCKSADTITVGFPKVTAKYRLSDTMLCLNQNNFSVKDTSILKDDARLKSTWYFGDGSNKVDTIAKKKFTTEGPFFIKLVVQGQTKCKDSISKKVVILPSAAPGFNINKPQQCFNGHGFSFSNSSSVSSGVLTYAWSFGDDSTSALKDISNKTYLKDSTYPVKLITTTDKNCSDTISKAVSIYPNPKSKFTPSKTAQCFNKNSTNFTPSSTIRKGFIFTYKWTLGDGNTSFAFNITNKKYLSADSFVVSLLNISDKGCRDSVSHTVYIYPNASIGFTINQPKQCFKGHSFSFTNSSTISKGSLSYNWAFGDDSTSTLQNISSKTYLKDSSYTVCLITSSDKACNDTLTKNVAVVPNPKAIFTVLKPSQCFNYNNSIFSNFSNVSKGTISGNQWSFSDSTTLSTKDVMVKHFNRADSFKVSLLVITDQGCRDSSTASIVIYPNAIIGYIIDKDTQCYEWHKFNFTNSTIVNKGFITTYNWALGDGSTASFKDITNKIYNVAGKYNVRLITSTDKNCLDTIVHPVTLNASPLAGFTIDKGRQCFKGNAFNYTNTSTINQGVIAKNIWDLGNTQTSNNLNITSLSYLTEDTFKVRLITLSDNGCYDTASQIAVTYAQPYVKFIVPNDSQCWQNNYFNIINQTKLKYGTLINKWDFGDNTTDNVYTPTTKKYANTSATYIIRYTASTAYGCADSAKHVIKLYERPQAQFTINDSVQCFRGHLFSFANTTTFSVMNTLSYSWDYGNGNQSAGINPVNATYPNAQYYKVRLIVYSSLTNCFDTLVQKVLPAPHAVPDFTVDRDSQCMRFNLFNFTDKSTLTFGSMTYKWTYGDNTFSTLANPSKHYNNGSTYNVKLVVTTNQLCSDSITKPVVIIPHPKAGFTINDSTQCLNKHAFDFTNTTTLAYGTYTNHWLADDTTDSYSTDLLSKKFKYGKRHYISLTVNSDHNCTDTFRQSIFLERPLSTQLTLVENDSQCQRWNRYTFAVNSADPLISIVGRNWDFGDGNTSSNSVPMHHFAAEGNYNVSVQTLSQTGCYDTAFIPVVLHPHPVSDFIANEPCFPDPVLFTDKSTITKGTVDSTLWSFDNGTSSPFKNPIVKYALSGYYNITLITESNYGCRDTLIRANGAHVKVKPKAGFSYTQLTSKQGEMINIRYKDASSSDVVSRYWTFGDGTNSTSDNPEVAYTDTGVQLTTLYVTNGDQCSDTFRMRSASLFPDFFFYLPNAFSPGIAGNNDIFLPVGSQYVSYYLMEIYNRWGEKIFETTDVKKGWDGTYMGQDCEQGTYICKIYLIPINGKKQFHKTSVTLLR